MKAIGTLVGFQSRDIISLWGEWRKKIKKIVTNDRHLDRPLRNNDSETSNSQK